MVRLRSPTIKAQKKEEPTPLFFSQHAAFAILWFPLREGGRTAVRPCPRGCVEGKSFLSIEPPFANLIPHT